MEFFMTFLFGLSGLSMIFWVAVIGLWHADMFPRFFKEDSFKISSAINKNSVIKDTNSQLIDPGALRPSLEGAGLLDREKYSRKSFVIADFSPLETDYGVNRLYTFILLSLGAMSFIVVSYAFQTAISSILPA